jgi:conjugal transfer pilus assembly protein TrbC
MRLIYIVVSVAIASAGTAALLAQNVEGVDIEAIKARSAELQADAESFVEMVKDRGEAFREDAAQSREQGMDNMRRVAESDLPKGPAGPIDFDELVAGAAGNASLKSGEAPQLIAFASLSMPPQALKQMIRDTARAGGVVVFRGFPNNSMKEFTRRLGEVVEKEDQTANIGIDPRLFRAFDVQAVPTYVAVSSDFDLCAGFRCETPVPPHDRMVGNVTVDYALSSFVDGNGPGARIAAVGLANMRRPDR